MAEPVVDLKFNTQYTTENFALRDIPLIFLQGPVWTLCTHGDWLFSGSSDKTIKVCVTTWRPGFLFVTAVFSFTFTAEKTGSFLILPAYCDLLVVQTKQSFPF